MRLRSPYDRRSLLLLEPGILHARTTRRDDDSNADSRSRVLRHTGCDARQRCWNCRNDVQTVVGVRASAAACTSLVRRESVARLGASDRATSKFSRRWAGDPASGIRAALSLAIIGATSDSVFEPMTIETSTPYRPVSESAALCSKRKRVPLSFIKGHFRRAAALLRTAHLVVLQDVGLLRYR